MLDEMPLDQIDSKTLFGDKKVINANNGKMDDDSVCEVKFCTGGRLSAPPVLHFYDYNMMSAQLIAELPTADNHLPIIVKILNSMVVEDFDCGQLHIEETKEVLLNVHEKWWSPHLQGFPYFLNPALEGDELMKKDNVSYADIPIGNLNIVPLPDKIKEPINIKVGGTSIQFIYPRIQNSGITEELMKVKFADKEQQFFKIRKMIKDKRTDEVPLVDLEAYNDYLAERAKWKLLYTRAQYICGINGDVLETLDERVDALINNRRIGLQHFEQYNKFLEEEGVFGLQDEVEFYSEILDEKVKRPFRLRTYAFIPQVDAKRYGKNEISFG